MTHFDVSSHRANGALVVTPQGELDIAAAEAMREVLAQRGTGEALVIDLGELEFMDTSGIQLVVEAHRASREEGFELRLRPAPPAVQRVFEIAGLDKVLPFEPGSPDA